MSAENDPTALSVNHYRRPWNWSDQLMSDAAERLERWCSAGNGLAAVNKVRAHLDEGPGSARRAHGDRRGSGSGTGSGQRRQHSSESSYSGYSDLGVRLQDDWVMAVRACRTQAGRSRPRMDAPVTVMPGVSRARDASIWSQRWRWPGRYCGRLRRHGVTRVTPSPCSPIVSANSWRRVSTSADLWRYSQRRSSTRPAETRRMAWSPSS